MARAAAIRTTSRVYPTANYVNADGDTTRTETVTYYLLADSSGAADMFVLYRQYNDQTPQELIDGLYLPSGQEFFSYHRIVNNRLAEIPDDTVIFWTSPRMAEIRTVGLRASGRYVSKFDSTEFVRTIETRVTLPTRQSVTAEAAVVTCGAAPAAPASGLTAAVSTLPRGATLGWNKSANDTGEPTSVLTYVIERRPSGGTWRAIGAVTATGASAYTYLDPLERLTGTFQYRVRALGCGGTASANAALPNVTL